MRQPGGEEGSRPALPAGVFLETPDGPTGQRKVQVSVPRSKPTYIAGTPRSSGDVQTGEIPITRGGGRCASFPSGLVTADAMIYSGAGRLASVLITNQAATSGSQILFYDAAAATSGGPYATSGHKVIGATPGSFQGGVASGFNPSVLAGSVLIFDMPFQSGLAVGGLASAVRSGSAGFTVSFTPESNSDQGGAFVGA